MDDKMELRGENRVGPSEEYMGEEARQGNRGYNL